MVNKRFGFRFIFLFAMVASMTIFGQVGDNDNSVSYPQLIESESVLIPLSPGIPLGFEATIGLRVFLNKNIGLYSEVGISKSLIQGGLSFKL